MLLYLDILSVKVKMNKLNTRTNVFCFFVLLRAAAAAATAAAAAAGPTAATIGFSKFVFSFLSF